MLLEIKKLNNLSDRELVEEINHKLAETSERAYNEGLEHGHYECIANMLLSGAHPKFIAKIAQIDVTHVLSIQKQARGF